MNKENCYLAYKHPTRDVWNRAKEEGVSFGYEPRSRELSVNFDNLKISDCDTKSQMEEKEKELTKAIESNKDGITEIMRQERVLKDVIEIIDAIRANKNTMLPVHRDLLTRCREGLNEHL